MESVHLSVMALGQPLVMELEKRLAMETGSYESIRGSNIGKHMNFGGGTELLTGQSARRIRTGDQTNEQLLQTLKSAMDEGRPVTVGAHSESATDTAFNQAGKAEGVVFNHAYSLKEVDVERGTLTLDNPWGPNVKDLVIDIDKFQKFFQSAQVTNSAKVTDVPTSLHPEAGGIGAGQVDGAIGPMQLPEGPTVSMPEASIGVQASAAKGR